MVKLVFMWRYAKDRPQEESEHHYLTYHTAKTLEYMRDFPGFLKYVQNKVVRHQELRYNRPPAVDVPPAFDRSVEIFFTDHAAMQACVESPPMQELWDDHPNFMDCGSLTQDAYELEETVQAVRGLDGSFYTRAAPAPQGWR